MNHPARNVRPAVSASLAVESVAPVRLSRLVGESLFQNGWLLDREELFDQSFARLRHEFGTGSVTDTQIAEVVLRAGRSMTEDALTAAPSALEAGGFARHLSTLLGLTEAEALGSLVRFHKLPIEDRRAFLSLLLVPDGKASSAPEGSLPAGFEGVVDDDSGTLARGARRALLALLDFDPTDKNESEEVDHD